MNAEFSANVKLVLAKRANERCSICNATTSKPNINEENSYINLGEAAHIYGARYAENNRYDQNMTDEQRSSILNAIWLCRKCHKEIDSDATKYTIAFLHEKKRLHEDNVSLGYYDIQWKEYDQLKERISDLKNLISEKEKNEALKNRLGEMEISELKMKLELVLAQKAEIETNFELLSATTSGFNIESANEELNAIFKSIKQGDFDRAKKELSLPKMEQEEEVMGRKRLLKANLEEIEKHYDEAESNYLKAYQIFDSEEFFESYVSFLMRRGKRRNAFIACEERLKTVTDLDTKVWLYMALGDLSSQLSNNEHAIIYLLKAKELVEPTELTSVDNRLILARILTTLGIANKNLGKYDEALHLYQESLIFYRHIREIYGIDCQKEIGDLDLNVATLYLDNNRPTEALEYYQRAEVVYKMVNDTIGMIILALNSFEACLHPKLDNKNKAREIINKVIEECCVEYSERPLTTLKYYAGALSKSARLFALESNFDRAEKEIISAIKLYEDQYEFVGVKDENIVATLYATCAEIFRQENQPEKALPYYDKAITMLLSLSDSEHFKHLGLAMQYAMRSEVQSDNNKIKTDLENAYGHIVQCNVTMVAAASYWKGKIEEMLSQ